MTFKKIPFFLIILLISIVAQADNNYFPGSEWDSVSPESQGVQTTKVNKLIDMSFNDMQPLALLLSKMEKL